MKSNIKTNPEYFQLAKDLIYQEGLLIRRSSHPTEKQEQRAREIGINHERCVCIKALELMGDDIAKSIKDKYTDDFLYLTREQAIRHQSWDGPPASLSLTEHLKDLRDDIVNELSPQPTKEEEI